MLPIPELSEPLCDCCGLPIHLKLGNLCPRCGYPVSMPKEEHFLEESIRNLQRVVIYGGGAQATVTNLLKRYQTRLDAIHRLMYIAPAKQNTPAARSEVIALPSIEQPTVQISSSDKQNNQVPPIADSPHVFAEQASVPPPTQSAQLSTAPVPPTPKRMFSLWSFFADQTINIVSSLGAFLILIGSLSFVVTTTNFFLSFLVLFFVHLIFAIVGFVFARFPSFRIISRVYTTIFALLVPLVGFSGYRLVAGHLIQLSAPTVVAIAATYAAIVYTLLAVSQQYKPFGYLAGVALVVADLAVAFALQLTYWWWPVLLMPLAFVALPLVGNNGRLLSRGLAVLREPVRVLMYTCVAVLFLDIVCSYLYMIASEAIVHQPLPEIRVAGAIMLLLIVVWTCTYFWSTKQPTWLAVVPYQLLGFIMALAYVFNLHLVACGLLFTAIAVVFHISVLVARSPLQRFQSLRNHTEGIALVLVAFVPLLLAPLAPLQLLKMAYNVSDVQFLVSGDTFLALIALLGSCVLVISMVLSHTGLRRIPAPTHTAWRWLLLLSGFLFTWSYVIVVLLLHVTPAYAFLALTLVLLIGTIVIRRSISTAWSHPLDILVLGEAGLTLLFHSSYGVDANLALLFLFAVLSYSVILYQQRYVWLFVPVVFMLSAFPLLLERPRILLLLAVALPLVALAITKVHQNKRGVTAPTASFLNVPFTEMFSWEWPVLITGLFYGIVVCSVDASFPTSTVQSWSGVPFSVALEMAVLALLWYIVAVLARQQWMLLMTIGFAFASMLVPSNPVWVLVCVACVAALLALGMSRIAASIWTVPLYIIALAAAGLTGVDGMVRGVNSPFATAIPDALLLYALVAYAVLIVERRAGWLWLAAVFAVWGSVLIAQLHPDVFRSSSAQIAFPTYYLTGVALVAGGIAIVAGRLSKKRDGAPSLGLSAFTWSWPWYCVALFAIGVTVVWNTMMGGVQNSGITVYSSLFAFVVLSCVVMLVERRRELSVVPILLMLWGVTQAHGAIWEQMGLLSIFFFLVFAMHYVWHLIPAQMQGVSRDKLFTWAGLVGQVLVLLMIIAQGGLSPDATALAHVGIGALLLLAVQLFWYGWTERATPYWAFYAAGLLVALAIPWELVTFHLTRIEWFALAPATYLIVIAPFLSRNEHVVHHQRLGQICSMFGAALLLLPTLWSSFSDASIQPTFILAGEALALLLTGVAMRVRFFVLSGAGLVIVSAMHALFLPSLGLPPSLALTIMGVALLALATALSLARHRLQIVWTRLD